MQQLILNSFHFNLESEDNKICVKSIFMKFESNL